LTNSAGRAVVGHARTTGHARRAVGPATGGPGLLARPVVIAAAGTRRRIAVAEPVDAPLAGCTSALTAAGALSLERAAVASRAAGDASPPGRAARRRGLRVAHGPDTATIRAHAAAARSGGAVVARQTRRTGLTQRAACARRGACLARGPVAASVGARDCVAGAVPRQAVLTRSACWARPALTAAGGVAAVAPRRITAGADARARGALAARRARCTTGTAGSELAAVTVTVGRARKARRARPTVATGEAPVVNLRREPAGTKDKRTKENPEHPVCQSPDRDTHGQLNDNPPGPEGW
jgi:hypothetical protein